MSPRWEATWGEPWIPERWTVPAECHLIIFCLKLFIKSKYGRWQDLICVQAVAVQSLKAGYAPLGCPRDPFRQQWPSGIGEMEQYPVAQRRLRPLRCDPWWPSYNLLNCSGNKPLLISSDLLTVERKFPSSTIFSGTEYLLSISRVFSLILNFYWGPKCVF